MHVVQTVNKSFSLTFIRTVIFAIAGTLLPILFHIGGLAGNVFLPIYFFTLLGGYLYGWQAGLAIAFAVPLANHFLTGMPVSFILPVVIFKGALLAILASHLGSKVTFLGLGFVIFGYQLAGIIFESMYLSNIGRAFNHGLIAWPGLLLQLTLGFYLLRKFSK